MIKKRLIVIAISVLILGALTGMILGMFQLGRIQQRNFEVLLQQTRENADQISQVGRLFKRVGDDVNEVRGALQMEEVDYSLVPVIGKQGAEESDRFEMFIEAIGAMDSHYRKTEESLLINQLLEELDQKAEEGDLEAYNLLDIKLHKTLIQASDNKIIISLYNNLFDLLVRSFHKTGGMRGSVEDSRIQHRQMLEAIIASDAPRARDIMERHISRSLEKLQPRQEERDPPSRKD